MHNFAKTVENREGFLIKHCLVLPDEDKVARIGLDESDVALLPSRVCFRG